VRASDKSIFRWRALCGRAQVIYQKHSPIDICSLLSNGNIKVKINIVLQNLPNTACTGQVRALPTLAGFWPQRRILRL